MIKKNYKALLKKNYKALLPSLFGMLFSLIILLTATSVAWFAMNRKVDSNGMQINVEVTPNLIIAKSLEDIRNVAPATASAAFSIDYTGTARTYMAPATAAVNENNEWVTAIAEAGDNVTGLKYVKNTNDIDFSSGIAKNDKELQFKPVLVDSNSKYYIDYDIYIASLGKELDAQALIAIIYCNLSVDYNTSHMAATIAFYQDFASATTLKGSIAVANVANQSTGSVSFALTDNKIPVNTDKNKSPIHIIARCYFDGALMNGDTAYINSATVDTSDINLKIIFTATELQPDN